MVADFRPRMAGIAIVLLAAGASSRFGSPKLEQHLNGRRLIDHAVGNAQASLPAALIVVVRPGRSFSGLPGRVEHVENIDRAGGLSSSVKRGALAASHFDAVIFQPADQPFISPGIYLRLAGKFREGHDAVVASYGGVSRNPVLLGRRLMPALQPLRGDAGIRQVLGNFDPITVECGDLGSPHDIDSPGDLAHHSSPFQTSHPDGQTNC